MTSIVLCSTLEAWQAFLWYALPEHRGCAFGNTQSRWPCGNRALFGRTAARIAPRLRYWLLAAPVRPSNKNPLSFFSLSV